MRISTQLTLFFVLFNGIAGVFVVTGVAADLGINAETGQPEQFEEITSKNEVQTGSAVGDTLFGMYNALGRQVGTILYSVTPGFQMLKIWLPDVWIDWILQPVAILIVTIDILGYMRGTRL